MINQEPAKARKRYKKNKPKRKISDMERKLTNRLNKQSTPNQRVGGRAFNTKGLNKGSNLITPKNGEVIDEDRKTFDKYMKDARGKKAEEKLPLLRKATKIHKELPDEDKK